MVHKIDSDNKMLTVMAHPQQASCLLHCPNKQEYTPHFHPISP